MDIVAPEPKAPVWKYLRMSKTPMVPEAIMSNTTDLEEAQMLSDILSSPNANDGQIERVNFSEIFSGGRLGERSGNPTSTEIDSFIVTP